MQENYKHRIIFAARVLLNKQPLPNLRNQCEPEDIPTITAEEVAEAKSFFPANKFFIFGHARSGTTLLTRLIRLHPQVHCNYQGHFFTRPPLLQSLVNDPQIKTWLTRRSNRWNRGRDLSPVVLRAVSDYILERDARIEGKAIVGDKSPNSLLNGQAVQLMHNIYPDASLIYIIRDGRDAVVSHRFQTFIDATQHLTKEDWRIRKEFVQDPILFTTGQRSIFTEKGLKRAAQGWVKNVQETIRIGTSLYGDQFRTLQFEQMLENTWKEISRLWSFLGADNTLPGLREALQSELQRNPDADWQQEKASGIAQSLQKGIPGGWQIILTPRDREIFLDIAGKTLTDWGYTI